LALARGALCLEPAAVPPTTLRRTRMTSTTSLASRTASPTLLTTAPQAGALPGAAAGAGRTAGAAAARGSASPVLAARTAGTGKASRAKASAAKKAAGTTAGKGATAKTGYAKTTLAPEYAFLRDGKLSFEEKLSRFIGLVMAKAENDLLAHMEKMSGAGKATGTSGTAGAPKTSGTGGAKAPKKVKGFSVWGALKVLMPQVGLATKVLGEAATKKLVQQLTGPVLAAAATALGFPVLAPAALQAGKALGSIATDDQKGAGAAANALGGLVASAALSVSGAGGAGQAGGMAGSGEASGSSGSGGASSGGASKPAAGGAPTSNMADQLEFQRLMERQKETFSILSNILRMNHEARMTSIQNIR
jgi:hypothetical protein